uniref:Uncharacterized protein n=1 Tax=Sinocyclocheilus grahami TaxID=75366 RepID=A0A672MHU0_SINGR
MISITEPEQVDQQPHGPHHDHHHGLLDLMGLREALDGLQDDGEAERGEEHGVDQRAHHLGPDPAERVFVGGLGLLRETHRHQSHDQRDHVRQHMKGVRKHRERQHAQQADPVRRAGHDSTASRARNKALNQHDTPSG